MSVALTVGNLSKSFSRDLPPAVDGWFEKACARNRDQRFADGAQMARALGEALGTLDGSLTAPMASPGAAPPAPDPGPRTEGPTRARPAPPEVLTTTAGFSPGGGAAAAPSPRSPPSRWGRAVTLAATIGVGGLAAASVARRTAARLGVGPTLIGSALVFGPATIAFPLAPVDFPLPFLVAGFALLGFGGILFNITGISLVQTLTPDRLLGRLNATRRFLVWGAIPLGSLAGGALASTIGLRPTLFVGAAGSCACFLPMLLSPLRTLREMPEEQETDPFQMPIAGATAAAAARLDA